MTSKSPGEFSHASNGIPGSMADGLIKISNLTPPKASKQKTKLVAMGGVRASQIIGAVTVEPRLRILSHVLLQSRTNAKASFFAPPKRTLNGWIFLKPRLFGCYLGSKSDKTQANELDFRSTLFFSMCREANQCPHSPTSGNKSPSQKLILPFINTFLVS